MAVVQITVSADKELVVSERKKVKTKHRFFALGIEMYTPEEVKKTAHIMRDLSVSAHWLMWCLISERDYSTNVVKFEFSEMDSAAKQRGVRGYKELKEKGLVIRIDRSVYMINPNFLLPSFDKFDECKKKWNEVVKAEGKVNE